jgi:hypothetical protein
MIPMKKLCRVFGLRLHSSRDGGHDALSHAVALPSPQQLAGPLPTPRANWDV